MGLEAQIIGGGFSGLVSAWALQRQGFKVEVFESSDRLGGMIQTLRHPFGTYETAANGLLNSELVMELFNDLRLELCRPSPAGRAKFIYRNRPRRWPLTTGESLMALKGLLRAKMKPHLMCPRPQGPKGFGFDHRWELSDVLRERKYGFVQGNFDQALLFADHDEFLNHLDLYLKPLRDLSPEQRRGWVSGLGHGVLPKTPERAVKEFVERMREVWK